MLITRLATLTLGVVAPIHNEKRGYQGRYDKQGPMDEHSSVATAAPIVALTLLLVVGAIALGALRAHAHEIPHLS